MFGQELVIPVLAALIPVSVGSIIAGYVHLWIKTTQNSARTDNLEGAAQTYNSGVKEFISAKFEAVSERFDAQDYRLERIERSLNGSLAPDTRHHAVN